MARKRADENAWHLDKRVPLALIFALFVQTASVAWWARGVSSDIGSLQSDVTALKTDMKNKNEKLESISILQTEMRNVKELLAAIREDLKEADRKREWAARSAKK